MNPIFKIGLLFLCALFLSGCGVTEQTAEYPEIDRTSVLPADIQKQSPETDQHPPILHSDEFLPPVPIPGLVNTSGAEDSAFILPDGKTLYFFFTPDVRIPPEKQILDNVTGVYVSRKKDGAWAKPERVWLSDPGTLALDGAVAIYGDEMWFASAREGFDGMHIFTAELIDDRWQNWQPVSSQLMDDFQLGEVHLHGNDLYFHSYLPGGKGDLDIWMTTRSDDGWSEPINIESVNTPGLDGFPCITPDGRELWLTRTIDGTPGILRSQKTETGWSTPELILSQFAGEPTLDSAGNLYFIHHYFVDGVMIEADIYIAYRK